MKALDIMHRQLDQTVILIMEIIQNLINEQGQSLVTIKAQKQYLLKQV